MKFSAAALALILPALALSKPARPTPVPGLPTRELPTAGVPTDVLPTLALPTVGLPTPVVPSAVSIPTLGARWADGDECPTSPVQCCDESYAHDSAVGNALLALSNQEDHHYDNVAIGCSPLVGDTCSAEPNCCTATGSLVSVGCVPVAL